jgi:hypothetical protein
MENEEKEVITNDPAEAKETEAEAEVQPEAEAKEDTKTEDKEAEDDGGLFELPDGRKVDGATLAKEWKQNFYPEFTRRSQKLKELESPKPEAKTNPQVGKQPWEDPSWEPKTWQEVFEANERRAEAKAEAQKAAEAESKRHINEWVDSQIAEIRKEEPKLNEDMLFSHAMKYGFHDIKSAYQNMKDMNLAVKNTERKVVDKLKARAGSSSPTGDGSSSGDSFTYDEFQAEISESPLEALRRLKSK